jgi:hypothetical protein
MKAPVPPEGATAANWIPLVENAGILLDKQMVTGRNDVHGRIFVKIRRGLAGALPGSGSSNICASPSGDIRGAMQNRETAGSRPYSGIKCLERAQVFYHNSLQAYPRQIWLIIAAGMQKTTAGIP